MSKIEFVSILHQPLRFAYPFQAFQQGNVLVSLFRTPNFISMTQIENQVLDPCDMERSKRCEWPFSPSMWEGMRIFKNWTFDHFAINGVLELTHCLEPELRKLDLVVGVRFDEGFQEDSARDGIGGDIRVMEIEGRREDGDRALSTGHDIHVKVGTFDS
jgi:hypothetical protein